MRSAKDGKRKPLRRRLRITPEIGALKNSQALSASEESAAAILAATMDFLRQTQPNRAARECRADPSTPLGMTHCVSQFLLRVLTGHHTRTLCWLFFVRRFEAIAGIWPVPLDFEQKGRGKLLTHLRLLCLSNRNLEALSV